MFRTSNIILGHLKKLVCLPGLTLAITLSLALGSGAATALYSVLRTCDQRVIPWRDPSSLALIGRFDPSAPDLGDHLPVSWERYQQWKDALGKLLRIEGFTWDTMRLTGLREARQTRVLEVTSGFIDLLGVELTLGHHPALGEEREILISDVLWSKEFERSPDVLGKALSVNNKVYTVCGVLQPGTRWKQADLILPIASTDSRLSSPGNWLFLLGRRSEGITIERLRNAMSSYRVLGNGTEAIPVPHDYVSEILGPLRKQQALLKAIVGFTLLLVLVNMTMLLLGRSSIRSGEFALRLAIGGRFQHIFSCIAVEGLVLSLPGHLCGWLLARWGETYLSIFVPSELRDFQVTGLREFLFGLAVSTLVVVLCSLLTAVFVYRHSPAALLNSPRATPSAKVRYLRNCLIGGQVGMATLLLSCLALVFASYRNLQTAPLGFDERNRLVAGFGFSFQSQEEFTSKWYALRSTLESLRATPGVISLGCASGIPSLTECGWNGNVSAEGAATKISTSFVASSEGYFESLGIPLLAGRLFTGTDIQPIPQTAIISRSLAAQLYNGESPIGRSIRWHSAVLTVIGVVGDLSFDGPKGSPNERCLFLPTLCSNSGEVQIVAKCAGDPNSIKAQIKKAIQGAWPDSPIEAASLRDLRASLNPAEKTKVNLLSLLAGCALIICVIGIYVGLSQEIGARRAEIAIRISLGASGVHLVNQIARSLIAASGVGALSGILGSILWGWSTPDYLFRVSPWDPALHIASLAILVLVVATGCTIPVRSISRIDPAKILKS